jgi:hypothetical protein
MLTDQLSAALEAAVGEPPFRQDPRQAWNRARRLQMRRRLLAAGVAAGVVVAAVIVFADTGATGRGRATVIPASPSPSAAFSVRRLSAVTVLRDGMATLAPASAGDVPGISASVAFQNAKPRVDMLPSTAQPVLTFGLYSDGFVGGRGTPGPVVDQRFKNSPMWVVEVPDVQQVVVFPPNYKGQKVRKTFGTVYILISATDGSWQGQFS